MLDQSDTDSDTYYETMYPRNGPFKDEYGDDPRGFYKPLRIRSNGEESEARDENFCISWVYRLEHIDKHTLATNRAKLATFAQTFDEIFEVAMMSEKSRRR